MKHIAFIFSLVVVMSMMAIIIINHQEKVPIRLLSVQKYYSYLYEDELKMEISLYINDIDHPIAFASSYEVIELTNPNESKKLDLELSKITYGYEEIYLNERYQQITLHLVLPDLGENFIIEDLMMNIVLVNGDTYAISLGVLSLISLESNSDALDWSALEGQKNENLFISRLGSIRIEYAELTQNIETIMIGIDERVEFTVLPNVILLSIPNENILLDDVPIIIYFEDGTIQTIANFRYMFDYEILKESGMLISTYALN